MYLRGRSADNDSMCRLLLSPMNYIHDGDVVKENRVACNR